MAFESGKRTTVSKPISPADTTIYLASVPTVTSGRLYLKNDAQEERISYSGVSWSTVTGCNRNLSKINDPVTSGVWLTRVAWTVVKLVLMHDQIVDKAWANTRVGNQNITGNLDVSGYLEADRIKAIKWSYATTYATTADRDTALGGDWVCLYPYAGIQANGVFYNYNTATAQWESVDTGTVTPNASTTAAGKVEKATSGEVTAWTATGWTGAELFVWPAELKTVTDWLTTSINAKPSIATNATASTGSNTTDAINPLQLKRYFWPEPSAGATYTAASAAISVPVNSWNWTYAQVKIWTIARTWTYTVAVTISAVSFWTQWYAKIYKNGVAFSSEQTNSSWASPATVARDLAYTEWDTLSLWVKSNGWGAWTVTFTDLSIKYSLVDQNAFTLA